MRFRVLLLSICISSSALAEQKVFHGMSWTGISKSERCANAIEKARVEALSEGYQKCEIEKGNKVHVVPPMLEAISFCSVSLTCRLNAQKFKEFEIEAEEKKNACMNLRNSYAVAYADQIQAWETIFQTQKRFAFRRSPQSHQSVAKKKGKRRPAVYVDRKDRSARKMKQKVVQTSMAIQEMNDFLRSLDETRREAVRLFHKGVMPAHHLKELLADKVNKGKKYEIAESCVPGRKEICTLTITTTSPFYKVFAIDIAPLQPTSVKVTVCYGALSVGHGDCVSRSDHQLEVAGQRSRNALIDTEVFPKAETYLAQKKVGSWEKYLAANGVLECAKGVDQDLQLARKVFDQEAHEREQKEIAREASKPRWLKVRDARRAAEAAALKSR